MQISFFKKHKFDNSQTYRHPLMLRPDSVWRFLVAGTFFLILIVAVFSAYLYVRIDRGEVFQNKVVDNIPKIDSQKFDQVIKYITTKQATFDALKVAAPTIVDPSK